MSHFGSPIGAVAMIAGGLVRGAATVGPVDRPTQLLFVKYKRYSSYHATGFNGAATVGPAAEIMERPKCSWRDII